MSGSVARLCLVALSVSFLFAPSSSQQSQQAQQLAQQARARSGLAPRLRASQQASASQEAAPAARQPLTAAAAATSAAGNNNSSRVQERAANNGNGPAGSTAVINRERDRERERERERAAGASGRLEFREDELPADFYEMPAERLDLGMNATGRAPNPILNVAVLQSGRVIDSAVTVHPGTPLEMVIYLDDKSAKVYGLLASYLKVQDDTARQREEVIILNGCSIDNYIFGNFELNPDDQSLRAKFRAFKFPDSNFVRFVGTVNVCIKQCAKVNCSASRKKRSPAPDQSAAATKSGLVVLTVSTLLRISD